MFKLLDHGIFRWQSGVSISAIALQSDIHVSYGFRSATFCFRWYFNFIPRKLHTAWKKRVRCLSQKRSFYLNAIIVTVLNFRRVLFRTALCNVIFGWDIEPSCKRRMQYKSDQRSSTRPGSLYWWTRMLAWSRGQKMVFF